MRGNLHHHFVRWRPKSAVVEAMAPGEVEVDTHRTTTDNVVQFRSKQNSLLRMEKSVDDGIYGQRYWAGREQLAEAGLLLTHLNFSRFYQNEVGGFVIDLEATCVDSDRLQLPMHRFKRGSSAGLFVGEDFSTTDDPTLDGLICHITSRSMSLLLSDRCVRTLHRMSMPLALLVKDESQPKIVDSSYLTNWLGTSSLHMLALQSEGPMATKLSVLHALGYSNDLPCREIVQVCFGSQAPRLKASPALSMFPEMEWKTQLNSCQKSAVILGLLALDVALIVGPPGTGKSTTLVELIWQLVQRESEVLVCCPSNSAVDALLRKCLDVGLKDCDRIGNVANLDEKLYCRVKSMLKKEDEQRKLLPEDAKRPPKTIFCTCDGAERLRGLQFDVVIVDEASQALEVTCWIPITLAKRCVLAGDHNQLGPVVKSREAAAQGLGETLFERLVKAHKDVVLQALEVQYRMNEKIMQWSSLKFYGGQLQADDSVKCRALRDLYPNLTERYCTPLIWVDTSVMKYMGESDFNHLPQGDDSTCNGYKSCSNLGEAAIVLKYVQRLVLMNGIATSDICVITPYLGQVTLIRTLLEEADMKRLGKAFSKSDFPAASKAANTPVCLSSIPVGTVDAFQGGEAEVIVVSFVRSNGQGTLGFLRDSRRLNVTVTRARRHLVVIGDRITLGADYLLASLFQHIAANGKVHQASQYLSKKDVLRFARQLKMPISSIQRSKK